MGLRLSVIDKILFFFPCDIEGSCLGCSGYFTERKAVLLPLIKFMQKKMKGAIFPMVTKNGWRMIREGLVHQQDRISGLPNVISP